jgi:hypothetical protein
LRRELALPGQNESAQHISAIQSISEQHRVPADQVAMLYERELASLRQEALIATYLSIFVTRRVNELLRTVDSTTSEGGGATATTQ